MKLTDTTIEIRPRSAWESIDLGILLARRHGLLLITSWAIVTLPIFCLLTIIFWQAPVVTIESWEIPLVPIIVFWWLKPIFDRIPLYILSNAVFGQVPTLSNTLKFWLKSFKHNTIADLTIRRLNLARSFELPVSQLEMFKGKARRQRLRNLHLGNNRAKLLTLLFINIEGILITTLLTVIFMISSSTPSILPNQEYTAETMLIDQLPFWKIHAYFFLYALVLLITEPIYVSCGFCLYLNRRVRMDAWDIELSFRRLSNRLTQTLSIVFITGCLVLIGGYPTHLQAEPLNNQQTTSTQQQRDTDKKQIEQILKSPPFFEQEEQTRLRWINDPTSSPEPSVKDSSSFNWLGWLSLDFFKVFIWAVVIFAVLLVLWLFAKHLSITKKYQKAVIPPEQLFGLAITPESLPTNIVEEFERYWQQGQTRQALSLLYRALLSHLAHQYQIPLKSSHTEGEIVTLTKQTQISTVTDFTQNLTNQWLLMAYGHYPIQPEQKQLLITGWQALMQLKNKEVIHEKTL